MDTSDLEEEVKQLNKRLARLDQMLKRTEMIEVMEIYANPKRRMLANLSAGVFRGLGMTIGTAIVIALLGWLISQFLTVPVIGDYVNDIIEYIRSYGSF